MRPSAVLGRESPSSESRAELSKAISVRYLLNIRSYSTAARCPHQVRGFNNTYASNLGAHHSTVMSAASTPSTTHPRTAMPAAIHRSDGSPRNKILRLLPPLELAALVERSGLVEMK